jgi:hypothetical protein
LPFPERPCTGAHDAATLTRVMPPVPGASPLFSRLGENRTAVCVYPVVSPRERLVLENNGGDDPSALVMRTAGTLSLPPATLKGITGVTHTHLSRSRYLVRPQLLTRL